MKPPKIMRVPDHRCPSCGVILGGVTFIEDCDEPPEEGDLSVCLHCEAPLQLGPNLEPLLLDVKTLSSEDQGRLLKAQAAIRHANRAAKANQN